MQEQRNTSVNALGYVVLALTHRHITSTYFVSYKNYVSIHIIKIVNYLYCMGFNWNNILRLMTRLILNAEVPRHFGHHVRCIPGVHNPSKFGTGSIFPLASNPRNARHKSRRCHPSDGHSGSRETSQFKPSCCLNGGYEHHLISNIHVQISNYGACL